MFQFGQPPAVLELLFQNTQAMQQRPTEIQKGKHNYIDFLIRFIHIDSIFLVPECEDPQGLVLLEVF